MRRAIRRTVSGNAQGGGGPATSSPKPEDAASVATARGGLEPYAVEKVPVPSPPSFGLRMTRQREESACPSPGIGEGAGALPERVWNR
jgi:hypothetical protein